MRVILCLLAALMASCNPWVEPNGGMAKRAVKAPTMTRASSIQVPQVMPTPAAKTLRIAEPGQMGSGEKWLSGAVSFRGLTDGQLAGFAVIPEGSNDIFQPKNGRYTHVDGFWWRGDPVNWYKIPDHAEAWVVGLDAVQPTTFDGVDKRSGFSVFRKALPGVGVASVLRGGVKEAGFHPRSGSTMIGVVYPF